MKIVHISIEATGDMGPDYEVSAVRHGMRVAHRTHEVSPANRYERHPDVSDHDIAEDHRSQSSWQESTGPCLYFQYIDFAARFPVCTWCTCLAPLPAAVG